jgi:hypothetical protein
MSVLVMDWPKSAWSEFRAIDRRRGIAVCELADSVFC